MSNRWRIVRLSFVTFAFVSSLVAGFRGASIAVPEAGITDGIAWLVAPAIMLLIVVGLQAWRLGPRATWHRPSWYRNPFSVSQPLQFFHLGAFFFVAGGVGYFAASLMGQKRASLTSNPAPVSGGCSTKAQPSSNATARARSRTALV